MTGYRIFMLNICGRVTGGSSVDCATDEDACAHAKTMMATGEQGEIWAGIRFVGRVSGALVSEISVMPQSTVESETMDNGTKGAQLE